MIRNISPLGSLVSKQWLTGQTGLPPLVFFVVVFTFYFKNNYKLTGSYKNATYYVSYTDYHKGNILHNHGTIL